MFLLAHGLGTIAATAAAMASAAEAKRRQEQGLPPIVIKPYVPTWKDTAGEWLFMFMLILPGILLGCTVGLLLWKLFSLHPAFQGAQIESP